MIADRDYLEQIGSKEIKELFTINAREIKQDVIDNVKSLDGDALVAAIDSAIAAGSWQNAQAIWDYIKSRRQQLRDNLSPEERAGLAAYVTGLQAQGTFVLMRGALEDYLPLGYRSKDLDKLIRFVSGDDFWSSLDGDAQTEMRNIANLVLG